MAETTKKNKKFGNFFKETKSELAKATWPTKSKLIRNTGVIIVFIAVVAIILSALDIGFGKLFQLITNQL